MERLKTLEGRPGRSLESREIDKGWAALIDSFGVVPIKTGCGNARHLSRGGRGAESFVARRLWEAWDAGEVLGHDGVTSAMAGRR